MPKINKLSKESGSFYPLTIPQAVINPATKETVFERSFDRDYDSNNPCGLGYVVLQKDKSFASQMTKTNTIYEVRYSFDLGDTSVTIPNNCVLKFNGGDLYNGSIVGNLTNIEASLVKIFNLDTTLEGTWNQEEVYPEWFGARSGISDDADAINAAINHTPIYSIYLQPNTIYNTVASIVLKNNIIFGCPFAEAGHEGAKNAEIHNASSNHVIITSAGVLTNATIKNIYIKKTSAFTYKGDGIHIDGDNGISRNIIKGVRVYNCYNGAYFGVVGYHGYTINKVEDCIFNYNVFGFTVAGSIEGQKMWINLNTWLNCNFSINKLCGLRFTRTKLTEENSFISCGFEANGRTTASTDVIELREGDNGNYVCGAYLGGSAAGINSFYNCYFENNKTSDFKTKLVDDEVNLNEAVGDYRKSAEIVLKGGSAYCFCTTFNMYAVPFLADNGYFNIAFNEGTLLADEDIVPDYLILVKNISEVSYFDYSSVQIHYLRAYERGAKIIKFLNCVSPSLLKVDIETTEISLKKDKNTGIDSRFKKLTGFNIQQGVDYPITSKPTVGNSLPTIDDLVPNGFCYFDTTSYRPLYKMGGGWWDANGIYYDHKKVGSFSEKPAESLTKGMYFMDTTLNQLLIYNGTAWTSFDGFSALGTRGATENRPNLGSGTNIGYHYYDQTLNKPIWWNGTTWVDATGTSV